MTAPSPRPKRRWPSWIPTLGVFLVMSAALWWSDQRAASERRWILGAADRGIELRSHPQKAIPWLPSIPFLDTLFSKEVLFIDLYDDADVDRLLSLPGPDPALCLFVDPRVTADRRLKLKSRFVTAEINFDWKL